MRKLIVGILGLGTVGGGTVDILKRNAREITRRTDVEIIVKTALVKNPEQPRICDCSDIKITTNPNDIIDDSEIDIVVEMIGGNELAKELVEQSINKGKHIVTANKALIALHGNELFQLAEKKGVRIAYEASVAGGIPIIKVLREGFAANQITLIAGIINGTGNFILSEMTLKDRSFADVLAQAQELGYAEADPTFDVEGIDAAHKLTILASIGFGMPLNFKKVYTEGISELSLDDVSYAAELGYKIKHLGIAKKTVKGVELRVHPTLIPEQRLLANVNGVMNAIVVKGNAVGTTLHYGAGAGAKATGSAVVADIIDLARIVNDANLQQIATPHLGFQPEQLMNCSLLAADDFECSFYLRLEASDEAGVMAKLAQTLAAKEISIEAVIQKEPLPGKTTVPIILVTAACLESTINSVIAKVSNLDAVVSKVTKIRIEQLH